MSTIETLTADERRYLNMPGSQTWPDITRKALRIIDQLTAQLPPEMQRCTIRFIECPVGHGRLTATNWVDGGCPHCRIRELTAEREEAQRLAVDLATHLDYCGWGDAWERECSEPLRVRTAAWLEALK